MDFKQQSDFGKIESLQFEADRDNLEGNYQVGLLNNNLRKLLRKILEENVNIKKRF